MDQKNYLIDIAKYLKENPITKDEKGQPFTSPDWTNRRFGDPSSSRPNYNSDVGEKNSEKNRVLQLQIDRSLEWGNLNSFDQSGARWAFSSLQLAISFGYINVDNIKTALDFGAGSGGPTLALREIMRVLNGNVKALESSKERASEITDKGILPQEQIVVGDGIAYLNNIDTDTKVDLITAFMLDPSFTEQEKARNFFNAAFNALTPSGKILLTSDHGTYSTMLELAQTMRLNISEIDGAADQEGKILVPQTLIISNR